MKLELYKDIELLNFFLLKITIIHPFPCVLYVLSIAPFTSDTQRTFPTLLQFAHPKHTSQSIGSRNEKRSIGKCLIINMCLMRGSSTPT
jgi:hypothetical protein